MSERKSGDSTDADIQPLPDDGEPAHAYPLPLHEGDIVDDRFAGIVQGAVAVLKKHGYEDLTPERLVALKQMLLHFMYGVRKQGGAPSDPGD